MSNISDVERAIDTVCAPLGEYAPKKRRFLVDYKDRNGDDFHEDLIGWHPLGMTDQSIVELVRSDLKQRGYELTGVMEFCEDGSQNTLYLSPVVLREIMIQYGLTIPEDFRGCLEGKGIRPVNLEELINDLCF